MGGWEIFLVKLSYDNSRGGKNYYPFNDANAHGTLTMLRFAKVLQKNIRLHLPPMKTSFSFLLINIPNVSGQQCKARVPETGDSAWTQIKFPSYESVIQSDGV